MKNSEDIMQKTIEIIAMKRDIHAALASNGGDDKLPLPVIFCAIVLAMVLAAIPVSIIIDILK
jgi:hypothetical protein